MKSCYSMRPDEVTVSVSNGVAYIVLCQNIESVITDGLETWMCDEHQIICPVDALDLNDVQANPAKYMDYEYKKPVEPDPAEVRMKELEDAIIELAEIIGG